MRARRNAVLIAGAILSLLSACQSRRIGWVEPVCVEGLADPLMAKMDTGSDRSSIDAQEIELIEREARPWVRFRIGDSGTRRLERPRVGEVHVRQQGGESLLRPTVHLVLQVADTRVTVEASLADRSRFDYPLLIGRDVLGGRFLVDSARRGEPTLSCPAP